MKKMGKKTNKKKTNKKKTTKKKNPKYDDSENVGLKPTNIFKLFNLFSKIKLEYTPKTLRNPEIKYLQEQMPPQPSLYTLQAQNLPCENSLNSRNNQIPSPPSTYNPSLQKTVNPQLRPQDNYTPQSLDNSYPSPPISPKQSNSSQGNNQTGVEIPVHPLHNRNINFEDIPHKRVFQLNRNTFHISLVGFAKYLIFIFPLIGIVLMLIPVFKNMRHNWFFLVIGILTLVFGLIPCFTQYCDIYFIMGQNYLKVIKKSIFCERVHIYEPGELQKIQFNFKYNFDSSDFEDRRYKYNMSIIHTNGKSETIFSISNNWIIFTQEEIDYFLSCINNHIQTKMSV